MKTLPLFLILPNIRSCHNVGAMFRTADGCGVSKIYLTGYTATPPHPQLDKVALGAEKWMPWVYRKDLTRLIKTLKKQGVFIVALEKTDTSESLDGWLAPNGVSAVALLLGNEVEGVPDTILRYCDAVVHIPMYGRKESFNVSVAAGIAMHQIHRQLL